jgi:hypothetical protein
MKLVTLKYSFIVLFIFCSVITSQGQTMLNGYKITMEMTADEKGDVAMNITYKYNAALWDMVKQNHGSDPSVLKNMWMRQFPKYELTNFSFPNADMDQTITSKFTVLGMMKVDAHGKWVAEFDQKDPNVTKLTDNSFLLVDQATANTLKINLPASASNAKVEKDSFEKAILTYTSPVNGGMMGNIIKWLGFLVAAGGVFLFFKNRGSLNTVFMKDASHKKIDYHEAKKIAEAVVINTTSKEPLKENVKANKATDERESNHE